MKHSSLRQTVKEFHTRNEEVRKHPPGQVTALYCLGDYRAAETPMAECLLGANEAYDPVLLSQDSVT